jgi:hypothetical protein
MGERFILFSIDISKLFWINDDDTDDPGDLCLHGNVVAKIGANIFECSTTVSAAGLYLLRSLTKNHIIHDGQPILPCCGHFMAANNDLSSVDIVGCSNGIDWSVVHEGSKVKLITESGCEAFVCIDEYKREIYAFADKVEAFYKSCPPKNMPSDEFDRNGYIAFWNEWHKRRKQA